MAFGDRDGLVHVPVAPVKALVVICRRTREAVVFRVKVLRAVPVPCAGKPGGRFLRKRRCFRVAACGRAALEIIKAVIFRRVLETLEPVYPCCVLAGGYAVGVLGVFPPEIVRAGGINAGPFYPARFAAYFAVLGKNPVDVKTHGVVAGFRGDLPPEAYFGRFFKDYGPFGDALLAVADMARLQGEHVFFFSLKTSRVGLGKERCVPPRVERLFFGAPLFKVLFEPGQRRDRLAFMRNFRDRRAVDLDIRKIGELTETVLLRYGHFYVVDIAGIQSVIKMVGVLVIVPGKDVRAGREDVFLCGPGGAHVDVVLVDAVDREAERGVAAGVYLPVEAENA